MSEADGGYLQGKEKVSLFLLWIFDFFVMQKIRRYRCYAACGRSEFVGYLSTYLLNIRKRKIYRGMIEDYMNGNVHLNEKSEAA